MKIMLVIRRSKDYWLNDKIDTGKILSLSPYLQGRADQAIVMWNICFKMQYIDFRKKLRNIAWKKVEENSFDDIHEYFDINEIKKIEHGTLVIPIDEDDWISSELTNTLRALGLSPKKGVHWEILKHCDGVFLHKRLACAESCGYGFIYPVSRLKLCDHQSIRDKSIFDCYIPKVLALKKHNISSLSKLRHANARHAISLKHYFVKQINEQLSEVDTVPMEYKKQEEEYLELIKELKESCTFDFYGV